MNLKMASELTLTGGVGIGYLKDGVCGTEGRGHSGKGMACRDQVNGAMYVHCKQTVTLE